MMCAWSEPHLETDRVGLPAPTRREAMMFLGATLLACGLAPVSRTLAARSDETAFAAVTVDGVLKALDAEPVPASQVALSVPDSVENGAVVPVEVTSHLPVPQEIFVVSAANPFPLVARFFIPDGTEPFVSTRIKVAQSCNVYALVQSGGRFYSAVKATQVSVGGCGG
jgi:sulfur-oxidizing protein SoxY